MRALLALTAVHLLALPGAAGGQTDPSHERRSFTGQVVTPIAVDYLLYLPPGYAERDDWPFLLFLHGAGERGEDLDRVKAHGPPRLIEEGGEPPLVVVSPQAGDGEIWRPEVLLALVEELLGGLRVDRHRIYLTGLSMGAYGAWDLAMARPGLFAAVAPVSGGGNPTGACRLADTPVWIFHGSDDDVIPVEWAETMARRLEACGGNVRITIHPDTGHDAWTRTYADERLLEWLLSQSRTRP